MAYTLSEEFIAAVSFLTAWDQWASQKPSLKHPIKYIKWRLNEPKYENFIKETNK